MTRAELASHLKDQTYPVSGDKLRNDPKVNDLSNEDKNFIRSLPSGQYDDEEAVAKALGL